MGFVPGCPVDDIGGFGVLVPQAVVLHRTYGGWPGDYSVIKSGGLCQILIGKAPGQWVQFVSTEGLAWHCNGANRKAFGIELTGVNEDPLTDWQIDRLRDVLNYAHAAHGIPLDYLDPSTVAPASVWVNGGQFRGVISHVSVKTDDGSSQHTDQISPLDYLRAVLGGLDMALDDNDILRIAQAVGGNNQEFWGKANNVGDVINEVHAMRDQITRLVQGIPAAQATASVDFDALATAVADKLAARLKA